MFLNTLYINNTYEQLTKIYIYINVHWHDFLNVEILIFTNVTIMYMIVYFFFKIIVFINEYTHQKKILLSNDKECLYSVNINNPLLI